MLKKIVIVGAGMMGSAMSHPAAYNGHDIRIIGTPLDADIIRFARDTGAHLTMRRPLPQGVRFDTADALGEAVTSADIVLCGVSSFGVDWFADAVLPLVPECAPVLAVTKGMIDMPDGALVPFPRVFEERSQRSLSFNAIGGPCTSYELADHRHSSVVFCGNNPKILRMLKQTFETPYYHISVSTDVQGVECAVALKNAFALGVSLAIGQIQREEGDGATLAYNPQAALFGQSVREMSRILKIVGGQPDNIVYGAGDLYVTIFGGRTRLLGTLLGRGLPFDQAIERLQGVTLESVSIARRTVRAIRSLADAGKASLSDFPLLMHIGALLDGAVDIDVPWRAFETDDI
ncbi:MAG: glycerol-3-phosphate dehydrogenase [Oscillospiraceae bacterium]|jgi:glycerol-3-phosphate dehydrogenase (NAD(P)+)|nr:glycerol-3-phosphate dehydrogenase [Oscillospiraceae bacterium]